MTTTKGGGFCFSKSNPVSSSAHVEKIKNKQNVFQEIREHVESDRLLTYAKELGLSDEYELVEIK